MRSHLIHTAALLTLASAAALFAQTAQVVRIPDATLRGRLLSLGVDSNNDGAIQPSEAREIEILDLKGLGIIDATGLNAFTNLRVLDLESNKLERVDVGALTKLERLNIRRNQLGSLDVSRLKVLKNLDIRVNRLMELSVRDLPALEVLSLVQNESLSNLTLANLPSLKELFVSHTQVAAVDLRPFRKLDTFEAFNSALQKVELGDNPMLSAMVLTNSGVESLDLHGLKSLKILRAGGCQKLRQINTAGASSLEEADFEGSGIVTADFTGSPKLREIKLGKNPIVEVNVRGLAYLERLDCFDERRPRPSLRQLDLSGTVRLRFLQL